jgi:dienelactone hydrolase
LALGALHLLASVALSAAIAPTACASRVRATGGIEATNASAQSPIESPAPAPTAAPRSSFAVGVRVLRLVDTSRLIRFPNGRIEPRTLTTYVRYPALGAPGRTDLLDAPAARADGPFPLVVFGHGFALTPTSYARLLRSWAQAGYVVAAPVFPLENTHAPGGPDESDLVNQPSDMQFVISRLLVAGRASTGPLAGLLDAGQIAVAGHSDGAETALAVAYSRKFRDPRVRAAMILSGAEMPGVGGFNFAHGSPALLATQGTADVVNESRFTDAFFRLAKRPKYLLRLLGAGHLPPYSSQQPQLAIVERVSLAFLDAYLKHQPAALAQLRSLGNVPRTAELVGAR